MTAHSLGYAWIQEQLGAPDFLGPRRARVAAVQSLQRLPEGALLVPPRLAPTPRWLDQALFAIKHEGVHLGYLAGALRQVDDATLREAVALTPNGAYLRKLGFLWEVFNGRPIEGLDDPGIRAVYVPLFDQAEYLTGASRRHPRWTCTCGRRWRFWACSTRWRATSTPGTTCAAATWPP